MTIKQRGSNNAVYLYNNFVLRWTKLHMESINRNYASEFYRDRLKPHLIYVLKLENDTTL